MENENKMNNDKIILTYVGDDDFSHPTFEVGNTGKYVKDLNMGESKPDLYWCSPKTEQDGEPGHQFSTSCDVEFVGYNPVSYVKKSSYMLLSRMQQDCEYYLNEGNRNANNLWAGNETAQITEMKRLYNSFEDSQKPQWLSMQDIERYEDLMCNNEKLDIHEDVITSYLREQNAFDGDLYGKTVIYGFNDKLNSIECTVKGETIWQDGEEILFAMCDDGSLIQAPKSMFQLIEKEEMHIDSDNIIDDNLSNDEMMENDTSFQQQMM